MKELLKLVTKLGGEDAVLTVSRDGARSTEGKLCTLTLIQKWLTDRHNIIVFVMPSVTRVGIEYKYLMVDARTGFYNTKSESRYEFDSYMRALEAGVWSGLTYIHN